MQICLAHGIQHGIYPAATVLHQMEVLHQMHEQPIPGGLPLLQSIDGHSAIEADRITSSQKARQHACRCPDIVTGEIGKAKVMD
jgi:hypothetical protein